MEYLRTTYDRIAEDWVRDHQNDTWWLEGAELFARHLPPKASILDAGCGGGLKSRFFHQRKFHLTGVDFSPKMIEIARREVPEVAFACMDIHSLDFPDQHFDAIYAQAVLMHLPKKELCDVFAEFRRVLKPGGHLFASVKEGWPELPTEDVVTKSKYGHLYQRFFSFYQEEEFEDYCRKAGWEVIEHMRTPVAHSRWLQIVAKKVEPIQGSV